MTKPAYNDLYHAAKRLLVLIERDAEVNGANYAEIFLDEEEVEALRDAVAKLEAA